MLALEEEVLKSLGTAVAVSIGDFKKTSQE